MSPARAGNTLDFKDCEDWAYYIRPTVHVAPDDAYFGEREAILGHSKILAPNVGVRFRTSLGGPFSTLSLC